MSALDATIGPALLFCPGERAERFGKAVAGSDVAVLDLEDGTSGPNKETARAAVCAFVAATGADLVVRINHPSGERGIADVRALKAAGARRLLLPKTETIREIDAVCSTWGSGELEIILTIETAKGLLALPQLLAHPSVAGVSWGPYDMAADIGARSVRDDAGNLHSTFRYARDRLLLDAAAYAIPAYDTVSVELSDPATTRRDSAEAAELGFAGKFCIHPGQVDQIRSAFRPSDRQIDWATRLIAGFGAHGATLFEGDMVDEPMLRRARRILQQRDRFAAARDDG